MINAIVPQFSGFTSYMDTNKWQNSEKRKKRETSGWTLGGIGWNNPTV